MGWNGSYRTWEAAMDRWRECARSSLRALSQVREIGAIKHAHDRCTAVSGSGYARACSTCACAALRAFCSLLIGRCSRAWGRLSEASTARSAKSWAASFAGRASAGPMWAASLPPPTQQHASQRARAPRAAPGSCGAPEMAHATQSVRLIGRSSGTAPTASMDPRRAQYRSQCSA